MKFKISMTCVYKEYEGKIKMVQEQLLHWVGGGMNIRSGDKNLVGGVSWGYFSKWEGDK